jgi:hypothetical protein
VVWAAGPDGDWLRRYRIERRPERLSLTDMGRYNAQQRQEAELHARTMVTFMMRALIVFSMPMAEPPEPVFCSAPVEYLALV